MKRILALVLALLFLCSCAQAPKTGRVSEEELAKLREQYPYHVVDYQGLHVDFPIGYWDPTAILNPIRNVDDIVLAVIEIKSEPYYKTVHKDYPGKFQDLDDFMGQYPDLDESTAKQIFTLVPTRFIEAHLVEIIHGETALRKGETFELAISENYWDIEHTLSLYGKSMRFVCHLQPNHSAGVHAINPHAMAPHFSWYVTEDDVVLACVEAPGPDAYSGLYLESFKQEVLAILNEE